MISLCKICFSRLGKPFKDAVSFTKHPPPHRRTRALTDYELTCICDGENMNQVNSHTAESNAHSAAM